VLRLALRMLLRDWRAGELRVLALALVLAVGGVASVAFFADRVRQALTREAHQVLGADMLMTADHAWAPEFRDEIVRRGLQRAESMNFVSMVRAGNETLLAAVKAVTPGYPLRGKLRIAPGLNLPDADTDAVPPRGTVWLDERMMAALKVRPGDAIELGRARFRAGAMLTLEPDRGVSFMNFAPRLMMQLDDLPATRLVQPGSRISYQLLAAGEREGIRQLEQWTRARLGRGERVDSLDNARPEVRAGLDRAQSFLGLTAMLAVVLSAVAIALGTRRYTQRHLDGYAVMRCLGAAQSQLFALFAWEFLLLALAASFAGCALGFVVQNLVAWWLAALIPGTLPPPGPAPVLQGAATGLVLLLGFALPPLLQLKEVPALRVIRRDVGPPRQAALAVYIVGLAAVFGLLLWQAGELKLASYVFGGFAAAFGIFAAIGYGALQLIGRLGRTGSISWRYGLANLLRRPRANAVQIVAIAVGLTAILLLTLIRGDLLDAWRGRLPPDAPDRFLVNIQPEQRQTLAEFLERNGVKRLQTFPMVRARLVAINGKPVGAEDYSDERARRQIEREFNLTYLSELPSENKITEGAWFGPEDLEHGAVSVEHWIAERFGMGLDAPEFLLHHHPGVARRLPGELRRELSCACGRCAPDLAPVAGVSQPHRNRRERDPAAGADGDGSVDRGGAAGVPVRARRRGAGAVRGAARDPGRAHARGGGDARARGKPRPGARRAARRVRRARRDRGSARLARRDRDRLDARDARVPARLHLERLDLAGRPRSRARLHRLERVGGRARGLEPPADGGAPRGHLSESRRYNDPWLKSL